MPCAADTAFSRTTATRSLSSPQPSARMASRVPPSAPSLLLLLLLFLSPAATSALKAGSTVNFKISEELGIGRVVGELASHLTAIGKETTFDGSDPYFSVSRTGRVTVRARVDREDPRLCPQRGPASCVHTFVVFAGKAMSVISVSVYIADVNDNEPMWESEPLVTVPENWPLGSLIDIPLAKDADGANNSIVSYELATPSKYFSMRTQRTGGGAVIPRLVVSRALDREHYAWHNLTLLAKDGSAPFYTGTTTVRIRISDQNDNAPAFDKQRYEAWVNEDVSRGHLVLRVRARDRDDGTNGQVRYRLAVSTPDFVRSAFAVDAREGLVTVAGPLNFEIRSSYRIRIVASDRGTPPKSAAATVLIHVADTNDHKPTITVRPFPKSLARVQVRENSANGTNIATAYVADDDAGRNGRVTCVLTPSADFSLEFLGRSGARSIYRIYTRRAFDRESAALREGSLTCRDHGATPQTAEHHLVVHIADENDNAPRFLPSAYYDRPVYEGNQPNAKVAAVSAADADDGENARLEFRLAWPPGDRNAALSPFAVDSDGAIVATRSLDRERHPDGFRFMVIATDHGKPRRSATATVSIRLHDVNDNAPVFNRSVYTFAVDESPERDPSAFPAFGALVGRVNATDADEGPNGAVSYRLEPSTAPFSVDGAGRILTTGSIDRETRDQYRLRVLATDRATAAETPLTATASVIINVRDVNDNAPAFRFPNSSHYRLRLSYREKPAFRVARVRAVDRDVGRNARLEYAIVKGNIYDLFLLRKSTGELILQNDMSAAHMGTIVLRLRAIDHGVPPRHNDTELELVIDDSPPLGGRQQPNKASAEGDWETNRMIIICIVLGTGVMCAVLATAICLIARRSPCPSNELHHTGRYCCPLSCCLCPNTEGSPAKYPMNCEVQEKLFDGCPAEMDSNGRTGGSTRLDTFHGPKVCSQPALLCPQTQSATLSSSGGMSTPGTIMEEAEVCHDSDDDSGRGGSVQLVPGQPDSLQLMERSYLAGGGMGTLTGANCAAHGRHKPGLMLSRHHAQHMELTPRVGGNYVTAPKKLKLPSSCHVIYEGRQSTSSMV